MRFVTMLAVCSVACLTACDKSSQPSSSQQAPPTDTLTITSIVGTPSPSIQRMIKIAEAIQKLDADAEVRGITCRRRSGAHKRQVCDVDWVTSDGNRCSGTFDVYVTESGAAVDSRSSVTSLCTLANN